MRKPKMFDKSGAGGQDKGAVPEIEVIRDILLKGLQRAQDARMDRIEERLSALSADIDTKLGVIVARIETVAAETGESHKKALMEIAHAISQIASGANLRSSSPEGGSAGEVRSSNPEGGSAGEVRSSSPEGDSAGEVRSSSPEGGSASEVRSSNPEGGSAGEVHSSSPEGGSASEVRSSNPEGGSAGEVHSSSPEGGSARRSALRRPRGREREQAGRRSAKQ